MAYASQAQIQMAAGGADRFLSLTDWNGDGAVDADVLADAQARADAWLDSYLRLRFATPIANPSATLARLSADEAVYTLRKSRGMLGDQDIEQRKERERELAEMRDGKLRPDEPLPLKSTAVASAVVPLGGCITRDGTKGMW